MANYDLTYEGSEVQKILDTGDELQTAGYIFRGEATPSTVPGTPTERVAYIGGPGTYTNFGSSITVGAGCICVFKYTGSAWSNQVINTGLSAAISSEAESRANADGQLQNAISAINAQIGNGYVYAGVATPSTEPVSGKVFYLAITDGTYTNFEDSEETPLAVTAGINILKNTGTGWVLDQVIAIDAEPTQGSDNLVKSGGVLNSIIQNGPAFDLSAYNAQEGVLATYTDLSDALAALNTLPADFKKGGMSIKYVHTSDNKYVQYRLISDEFSTTESDWQSMNVDDEPTAGSDNLVKSGGLAKLINDLEDSFYIIDKNRNIALILDDEGLKVKKIILIDNNQTRTIDSTFVDLINTLINNCQGIQEDNFGDFKIVDENGNIAFAIKKKGLECGKQVFHGENGKVYIIDEYNQISFCIKENGESSLVIDKDSFVKAFNKYKQYLNITVESENVYNGIKYRTQDNPIGLVNFGHTFASIIHHWGFIGDSLSSGLCYLWENGTGRIGVHYGYSFGQRLVKLLNAEGINWSISGWTTKMWCQTFWQNEQKGYTEEDYSLWGGAHPMTQSGTKFKDDPKQAYIIELGANDGVSPDGPEGYKHLDPGNVDTDIYDPSDPSTFAQNADTYAGWYAGIIQRIKTIAPSAKIFVMTLFPAFSDRTPYDNIVRQMPSIFRNVYLLDLKEYFVNSSAFQSACWEGGHFRPLGYQYVAYTVATYIDNIIREHPNDFKWMPFINTSVDEGNF